MNNRNRKTQNEDAKDLLGAVCFAALVIGFLSALVAGPLVYVSTVIDDEDAFVAVTGEVIEHPELDLAPAQRLVFVLAVQVDELFAERGERGERRGAAVDRGLGTAVGADHAAHDQAVAVVELLFAEPGEGGG